MVKVVAQGDMTVQSITIDPAAIDPEDAGYAAGHGCAAVQRGSARCFRPGFRSHWPGHGRHEYPRLDVSGRYSWNRLRPSKKLLDELERMPGVGPKSAQRIAYWLLNSPRDSALRLADAIVEVKDAVHFCSRCFNYSEGDVCEVCASASRDASTICVVSEPRDVSAIERTAAYSGLYHVLGGALSPMDGVGP